MITGQLIQTYRIEELLGEGGMGAVFRATDTVLERPVALKMLRAELLTQPQFLDRFRAEAQILARLNHPNVATLYNFIREAADYYMVMEFVEGQTLDQWLERYGPLPLDLAVQVVQQALEGLHHAHKRGILHRDLKPANLMVTPEGVVKLTDFGIARIMGSQRMTHINGLVGTPAYMAPEQIQGGEPSPQSDIHAMGLVLYELLSGQVPFATTNPFDTMERVMRMMPPPLRQQLAGLPPELDEILTCALQKDPGARFADARIFQKSLLSVAPYVSALDEASVIAYQQRVSSIPVPAPYSDKTFIENQSDNPPIVASISPSSPAASAKESEPVPSIQPPAVPLELTAKAASSVGNPESDIPLAQPNNPGAKPPKGKVIPVRAAGSQSPVLGRFRWKRVALWIGGIFLGIVLWGNWLMRSERGTADRHLTDSASMVASVSSASPTISPSDPKALAQSMPNQYQQKVTDAPVRPSSSSGESVKETIRSSSPPTETSYAARQALATDDDPTSVHRPQSLAPPSLPLPITPTVAAEGKPLPGEQAAESRVAESRGTKVENTESKGGSAPRVLKLSGGTEVVVALTEPVAAATARIGQPINCQVLKPVTVGGEVLIPPGASVQGEVANVSTGGKKDMLEIRIYSIRGSGGQRVDVKGGTFRYVGEPHEPLVFKSGQQFIIYTAGSYRFSL